ncbi:MAG: flagellar hook-basal body complex protein FliE [Candidatus Binatia bacterium]|nr:flagellar hook-basal body complex protein FliE [Candidatus Binatia bacterium]
MKEISLTGLPTATVPAVADRTPVSSQGHDFQTYLRQALGEVNDLQQQANQAIQQLIAGEQGDLQETIIALERADVAFRLMMQIRNKVLEAYQEIVRMQV